jgi:signal transduction histidine kinase
MRQEGCLSALQLPLVIGDKVFGACTVRFTSDKQFGAEELTLAKALALQATLALQLAKLEEQGRRTAVLDERNRMARDIHDTLAQGFTGVVIQLEAAKDATLHRRSREAKEHIQRASELARQSLAEARRSVHALRPMVLEQGSLSAAIEGLLRRMTSGTGIDARLSLDGVAWRLPPAWEEHLLHISQEALANALKHANPKNFQVNILFEPASIVLTLRDDGVGFDPTRTSSGLGLAGMHERVAHLAGRLSLRSAPGAGTEIVVTLGRASIPLAST